MKANLEIKGCNKIHSVELSPELLLMLTNPWTMLKIETCEEIA